MKMPRITNIWSRIRENGAGKLSSQVVIESTGRFGTMVREECGKVILEGSGVEANMPVGAVEVYDGLVTNIYLNQVTDDKIKILIDNEHLAEFKYEVTGELPVRFIVSLERDSILSLFQDKKIVIDPGHGGTDAGARGSVNLLEKNVVLPIARDLQELFKQAGARVFLTRQEDRMVTQRERWEVARRCEADLFLSIHTHADEDSKIGGVAVNYAAESPISAMLALLVKEELVRKLKLADRGGKIIKTYNAIKTVPLVEIEVVTITNWVEEGLLRSPTIHRKAAEGIFNGVKNFLAEQIPQ
ncbi:MAG: N-acetylmuramoyl-L-alanine amidase [Peptococcaceae bacterium]|nr:N-acetylmuramoyl-L-alanine amidase [Candidatus Syntrophopropionicum ammoniitolerans]